MLKNLRKKGFTIVELVIVIAVIAILAAILIPTFSGIIKKANIASDTAMAKNMNTALVMADSEGNVPEDMGDVLFILYEAGYVLENLNPTTNGYYFVWDETTNQILFLTDEYTVHYSSKVYSENSLDWWLPIKTKADIIPDEEFSYCMAKDIEGDLNFTYLANFDTNGFTLTGNISYGTSDAAVNDLGSFSVSGIIEGTLLVNAPNANVSHYGAVDNVNIVEVSQTSYHEHGFVKNILNLQAGRLVVENTGNATKVVLPISTSGRAENKGYIEVVGGDERASFENTGYVDTATVTVIGTQPSGTTAPAGFTVSINNLNQLEAFRDAVNFGMTCDGLTVKLMADIDISNRYWKPIGFNNKTLNAYRLLDSSNNDIGPDKVFKGTFDGNNKTISGLTNNGFVAPSALYWRNVGDTNGYAFGLFSVTYDATIKNLNMINVNIVSTVNPSACVGAIVGSARGNILIENCTVKGNIQGTDGVGGAVGYVYEMDYDSVPDKDRKKTVEFKNVTVEANVHGQRNGAAAGTRVGGIIGAVLMYNLYIYAANEHRPASYENNKFIMTGCSFKGAVLADDNIAGGLFGNSSSASWISNDAVGENAEITVSGNIVDATITSAKYSGRFFAGAFGNTKDFNNASLNITNNTFVGKVFAGGTDITAEYGDSIDN